MISIKVGNEYLDLEPGTQIQRERQSPFFLAKQSTGKDGIPAEVSYPFNIPLTDANMRRLGYPDLLQTVRRRQYDNVIFDDINQISAGKLQLGKQTMNLSKTGIGRIQANLFCNASHFAQLISGKKLKDLSMGGMRTFSWDGFNAWTGTGFWRHCHETWDYDNCDDGDYVFYPIVNSAYGGQCSMQNGLSIQFPDKKIELSRGYYNVTGLCPHTYMVKIIRWVFEEHGYSVTGEILDDYDFKKLTMASFRGIYWSEIRPVTGQNWLEAYPLSEISFQLGDHMPQEVTIGEFLVELMKFLPIGFDINDSSRTCTIRTLSKPRLAAQLKDFTAKIDPTISLEPNKAQKSNTVIGFRRNFGSDGLAGGSTDLTNLDFIETRELDTLPLPVLAPEGAVYRVIDTNTYHVKQNIDGTVTTVRLADNTGNYSPAGDNVEYIESAIVPMSQRASTGLITDEPVNFSPSARPYVCPHADVEGNWLGKPEAAVFGMHVAFYRGKTFDFNDFDALLLPCPYATNTNSRYNNAVGGSYTIEQDGNWSLSYKLQDVGLIDYWWKEWLRVLPETETLTATFLLPLHEYLQLGWADEILIENVSYVPKKLQDIFPYTGKVQAELVRWVKG